MTPGKKPMCAWPAWALAALVFFGVTNFLLGYIAEKSGAAPAASIKAAMILWLGCGLLGLAGTVYFTLTGRGFSGLPRQRFLLIPIAAGVSLALAMLLLNASLAANPLAKGPMVAVTSASSLVVALLAWTILREKLVPGQWLGILIVIVGIVLISLGGDGRAGLGAVGLASAAMVMFGITNFLLKLAGARNADSLTVAVVLWLAVGACGVLAMAWSGLAGSGFPVLSRPALTWLALLAGGFMALGMLAIKIALTLGPAGPAVSVSGSNAILVSLLDFGILGHWLPPLKLAGMLTAIAGIAALSLAGPKKKIAGQAKGET